MAGDILPLSYYIDGVTAGDRIALSRAITLVESSLPADQQRSEELLKELASSAGTAFRIAITGVPGAGKSTLIEALGKSYLDGGKTVAVLAIDPSSHVSGGSILGDKTRMPTLSVSDRAFVRPSPTRGILGGLTVATPEAIVLCEAAGFDVVFIETVGVGQAELDASDVADVVIVVLISGAGDDLQGVKRGILEVADIIVINKADGDNKVSVAAARTSLRSVISLLPSPRPDWSRAVVATSAAVGTGVAELADLISRFENVMKGSGHLGRNRDAQRHRRFEKLVTEFVRAEIASNPSLQREIHRAAEAVRAGIVSPTVGARRVTAQLRKLIQ